MSDKKTEALKLLEEALLQLESSKGTVTTGVQKLSRAAHLIDASDIYVWAEIQLGNSYYIKPFKQIINTLSKEIEKEESERNLDKFYDLADKVKDYGMDYDFHIKSSIEFKSKDNSGGLHGVDFIESNYNIFIKDKKGNNGKLYKTNLKVHLDYIKRTAHQYATELYNKLKFSGTVISSFDLLKNTVDDKLLDLNPELAEQLMLAFRSISSSSKEEWSHALTTCRRLLEGLADQLFPATDQVINGRTFKQNQYINRLWGFMDKSIESASNKDLAKAHLDYLGSWLQKSYTLTNKGVHAEVSQLEATRVVFHMYLLLGDLLEYLNEDGTAKNSKPSINDASLDEIEALLNIKREVAKAIIKARVQHKGLTLEQLSQVRGIGPKTLEIAKEEFLFGA